MDVSVVVPCYNSAPELELTLDALGQQTAPSGEGPEVIVVDDGSSDGTCALLERYRQRYPEWKVVFRARDHLSSRARARNLGASASTRHWLFFMDAGILPVPGLVSHVASLPRAPGVLGVCKMLGVFTKARRLPTAEAYLERRALFEKHPAWQDVREPFMTAWRRSPTALPAPWLLAWSGALAVPRPAFTAAGGFDDAYAGWGVEDVDLAARLMDSGLPLAWIDQYFAIHAPHARDGDRKREHGANTARLYEKRLDRESELYACLGDGFAANTLASRLDSLDLEAVAPHLDPSQLPPADRSLCLGLPPHAVPPRAAVVLHHKRSLSSEMRRVAPGAEHHCLVGLRLPYPDLAFNSVVMGDLVRLLPNASIEKLLTEACRVAEHVRVLLSSAAGHEAHYRALAGWPWASVDEILELARAGGLSAEVTHRERACLVELKRDGGRG